MGGVLQGGPGHTWELGGYIDNEVVV
jgi:hypothetical protein